MPSLIEISAELSRRWPELNNEGPINREETIRAVIASMLEKQTRCSFCGALFNTDTEPGKAALKNHICTCEKSPLVQTLIAAEDLVRHMWIHAAYNQNGYLQMTTEQKQMYCAAIGAEFDPLEPRFKDIEKCSCRACLTERGAIKTGTLTGHDITTVETGSVFVGMIVCEKCGNKRCPHANNHRNACTNSNEPGQSGSAY